MPVVAFVTNSKSDSTIARGGNSDVHPAANYARTHQKPPPSPATPTLLLGLQREEPVLERLYRR
jgi:hypothetical protein